MWKTAGIFNWLSDACGLAKDENVSAYGSRWNIFKAAKTNSLSNRLLDALFEETKSETGFPQGSGRQTKRVKERVTSISNNENKIDYQYFMEQCILCGW